MAGKVYEYNSAVTTFFNMSNNNKRLSERNLILEQQVKTLSQYIATHNGDSLTLDQCQKQALAGFKLIPAKVISSSTDKEDNLITIDKGRADGVHEDMGVACGTGIVGVVYMVSDHYAIVIPVINVNSNVSVTIQILSFSALLSITQTWRRLPKSVARRSCTLYDSPSAELNTWRIFPTMIPSGKMDE